VISLVRPEAITATLTVTNQPERTLALPRRPLRDCLAEELRRLDFDEVYAEVLAKGLPLVDRSGSAPNRATSTRAAPKPAAPKPAAAKATTPTAPAATAKSARTGAGKAARRPRATKAAGT
jgi:hypothetical protein